MPRSLYDEKALMVGFALAEYFSWRKFIWWKYTWGAPRLTAPHVKRVLGRTDCADLWCVLVQRAESSLQPHSIFFVCVSGVLAQGVELRIPCSLTASSTAAVKSRYASLLCNPYRTPRSQAFKGSHSGGNDKGEDRQAEGSKGSRPILPGKMGELLLERPTPAMYDAILVEPVPAEHRGGLWEFENEASYFDGDVEIEERQ